MSSYDPVTVDRWVDRLDRLFDTEGLMPVSVRGWEQLPARPALLVSNHSGGTLIPDVWGFAWAWVRRFGHDRRVHPLGHDMLFKTRTVGDACGRLGILRARRGVAREVLDAGLDLMVCPGGDRDTWRTWDQRYRVNFAGRRGYARLALQTGVPVSPVANVGAHETLVVLADGHRLARRVGLQRHFRASVFPLHLSLPWLIGVGPLPHIPWPVRLDYAIGAPVPLPQGWSAGEPDAGGEPEPGLVEVYHLRCRQAMQALLDELAAERDTRVEAVRAIGRVVRSSRRLLPRPRVLQRQPSRKRSKSRTATG